MDGNLEALGMRLCCFNRERQNGRTFCMFHKEEIGELLPKYTARTGKVELYG